MPLPASRRLTLMRTPLPRSRDGAFAVARMNSLSNDNKDANHSFPSSSPLSPTCAVLLHLLLLLRLLAPTGKSSFCLSCTLTVETLTADVVVVPAEAESSIAADYQTIVMEHIEKPDCTQTHHADSASHFSSLNTSSSSSSSSS